MRQITADTQGALDARAQWPRDFIEVRARAVADNSAVTDYLWSGGEDITHSVIDPFTGEATPHLWHGMGHLVAVSSVPRVSDLTISRVTVRLSNLSQRINDLIRAYHVKYSTVIFYRAFLAATGNFVGPGYSRFVGQIDSVQFRDGADGQEGSVDVVCKSSLQDLARSNPTTRSDAYQRQRDGADTFRAFTASMATRKFNWRE